MTSGEKVQSALKNASETKCVLAGSGVLNQVGSVFKEHFADQRALVVADENTFTAAGRAVVDQLKSDGVNVAEPLIFPAKPTLYCDTANVKPIAERINADDASPIAVGSGTINDLSKRAAHETGKRSMVVGTAASMDGYTAYGAALSEDGQKATFECAAPVAAIADLDVLAAAPPDMNASGYADLLAKVPAGVDWIIADALEVEPIARGAWELVQPDLREWVAGPKRLRDLDRDAIEDLFNGLAITGLAIQECRNTRAASGIEHLFSHHWEMQHLEYDDKWLSHGFKVGIGSIASAALQEYLLKLDPNDIDIDARCQQWQDWDEIEKQIRAFHFHDAIREKALKEMPTKFLSKDQLRQRLELLKDRWPVIRDQVEKHMMPAAELRDLLDEAGAPTDPADMGISLELLRHTYHAARQIRYRYTTFDIFVEAGWFDQCVDELFSQNGFWGKGV